MPVFQPIGPVSLVFQQTSSVFELSISENDPQYFIRVIALFGDGEPLGGEAPAFQISAGTGVFTSVEAGAQEVDILLPSGEVAAKAKCERERADIFLITLTEVRENAGPWKFRMRNNDPETQDFLGFCSEQVRDTQQPWMKLGKRGLELTGQKKDSIEVRNLGTAALIFNDEPGPISEEADSRLALHGRPNSLEPHEMGLITFETVENPLRSLSIPFQLNTNDTFEAHGMLTLQQIPRHTGTTGTGPVVIPETTGLFCRRGCGCMDFKGPHTAGATCERCGHPLPDHLPI
jgi:hypothetical protein